MILSMKIIVRHTGLTIKNDIINVLDEWGIQDNVGTTTVDGFAQNCRNSDLPRILKKRRRVLSRRSVSPDRHDDRYRSRTDHNRHERDGRSSRQHRRSPEESPARRAGRRRPQRDGSPHRCVRLSCFSFLSLHFLLPWGRRESFSSSISCSRFSSLSMSSLHSVLDLFPVSCSCFFYLLILSLYFSCSL